MKRQNIKATMVVSLLLLLGACSSGSGDDTNIDTNIDIGTDAGVDKPTDGQVSGSDNVTSSIEAALKSGDARLLESGDNVHQHIMNTIEGIRASEATLKNTLYAGVDNLSWNPTHDASLLLGEYGLNTEVLNVNADKDGNPSADGRALAVAGVKGNTKYMVYGGHPLRNLKANPDLVNDGMNTFMKNAVSWLTEGKSTDLNIALVHSDDSRWFKDESGTREWLTANYAEGLKINNDNACDGAALVNCLKDNVDLLIISQVLGDHSLADVEAGVAYATQQGIPILYMHHDGDLTNLGRSIFQQFNVHYSRDNYWPKLTINGANFSDFAQYPPNIAAIRTALINLDDANFPFNVADCAVDCDDQYATQFSNGESAVKSLFDSYDSSKFRLFDTEGYKFQKLLVLLADQFRNNIRYPMSVTTTDTTEFLKAKFADSLVYISRDINPVPADLGNYSRTDFSHVTPSTKTVSMTSKYNFKAAGVYALPGETVTVTRNDSNDVATSIRINTIRSGATHEWDADGYTRPKYLTSASLSIEPGETISFTSPYGGPIHITFNTNDVDVNFTFKNIGEHPYWAGPKDDESFALALALNDYDWAEFATNSFEIHSKAERVQHVLDTSYWTTPQELAAGIKLYATNYTHVLAGYQGPDLTPEPEISGWAEEQGFTLATVDMVKHMNADQATCGGACSGNPYDTYGVFHPVEHGNLHEIGHGLQSGWFLFTFGETSQGGHGATNFYSYYPRQRFYENTGIHSTPGASAICKVSAAPLYRSDFEALVQAANTDNPGATVAAMMERATLGELLPTDPSGLTNWGSYDYNYFVWWQLMNQARLHDKLDNGYHIIARMHILQRQFNTASSSDESWAAMRNNLGLSLYTREEAKAMSYNDWILISASRAVALNFSQPLNLLGVITSDKAKDQVSENGYAVIGNEFVTMNDQCASLVKDSRNVQELSDRGVTFEMKSTVITADTEWPWPEALVESNKAQYTTEEKIVISYDHSTGNQKDWIGIYSTADESEGGGQLLEWYYTEGNISGEMTFKSLPVGNYVATLYVNNGYEALGQTTFEVR
jgi:plastocyanin